MTKRAWVDKTAVALIVALLTFAGVVYALGLIRHAGAESLYAEVRVNGETVATRALPADDEFTTPVLPHVRFILRDNAAAVLHADCPGKHCVRAGYIRVGQTVVCLPNRFTLTIKTNKNTDQPDAVAY
jgi:hypothetical protein